MNQPNVDPPSDPTTVWVDIAPDPLDSEAVLSFVEDDLAGAIVLFSGTVRNHSPGRTGVSKLEYEAYGEVVSDKIREVVDEAFGRWDILRAAAIHRVGVLDVGESAVMVAVSSAHRSDAFPAGQYIIDELKHRAPIWKKEYWDGGSEWVREDHRGGTTDDLSR